MGIFLESFANPLLVLHALIAAALLGSCTHAAYELIRYLRDKPRRPALERLHARIIAVLYVVQFSLGALIYPTYRVKVRAMYFDTEFPWASNLFDIKEMFAAFGLGVVLVYVTLSFFYKAHEHRRLRGFYVFCGLCVTFIVWFAAISGFYLTTLKAV